MQTAREREIGSGDYGYHRTFESVGALVSSIYKQKKAAEEIKTAAKLKEVLGDKYEEGMTVIDVKYLYPYGAFSGKFPLTMTFNVTGVTSSSKVQVLAYNDETGQWEVVECTVGNGTVTAVLNSLSLVAFVVDGKTAGTINTATSTGSGSNTSTVSPKQVKAIP